ncbi:MAG: Lrp/AsnC family transcriptional regulator [Candidatus Sumerlaeaceae bacterium]|jgi:DNA-binding Lrp family transcriptional regulator
MSTHGKSLVDSLSELDRAVLNVIQTGFPVAHSPYAEMAKQIGNVTEEQVFECVLDLVERGIIRRLGAVFDTKKLGFMSALIAMRVPPERIDEVGEFVSEYAGVSHNYKREHDYNLWFTLAAPSRQQLMDTLDEIKKRTGVTDVLYLPTVRMHKIFVNFEIGPSTQATAPDTAGTEE